MGEDIFKDLLFRFQDLKYQRDSGQISQEQFLTEVKNLQIQDQYSTWWTIDPVNGTLIYYNGERWLQDTPSASQEVAGLPWKSIALVFALLLSIVLCVVIILGLYYVLVIAPESTTTLILGAGGLF